MNTREKMITFGLTLLLIVVWLGFTVHSSNEFAGSLLGSMFGIVGSVFMLIPLIYLFIKRIRLIQRLDSMLVIC